MKPKTKNTLDPSAEEKIKDAARKIFTQKGFAATKTRDIAAEAGINMAMLNYYFRSKEKLFEIVMMENMQKMMSGVAEIFFDETTTLEKKIELFIDAKVDTLIKNPDLLSFVLNEFKGNSHTLTDRFALMKKSHFIKQFNEAVKEGKIAPINPIHFIFNICGLLMFPFLAGPLLQGAGIINQKQFEEIILERKKLVPLWLKEIAKIKLK